MIRAISAPRLRPLWVLAASGALGFRVGYVGFPTWHVVAQTAQVLAGFVTYPPDNPFYIYHTKLWTILHQIGAVLLRAGVTEIQLSLLLSGLLGMLAFQAIALVVYAVSRQWWLAVGAAFLVVYTRAAEHGVIYPIFLMETEHTYGAVALSWFVLVVALLGSGCLRLGGLLLGLAPCVHPSVGAWLWFIVALAFSFEGRDVLERTRAARPYFVAGVVLTLVSLAVQMTLIYDVPNVDPEVARGYVSAFMTFWDGHRRPVDASSPGVILNAAALAVAVTLLSLRKRDMSEGSAFVLRAAALCAMVSATAMVMSWLPIDRLPLWLVTLMPARLLNVNAMLLAPLLFGLLAAERRPVPSAVNACLGFGLLVTAYSRLWQRPDAPAWASGLREYNGAWVLVAAAAAVIGTAWFQHWRRTASSNGRRHVSMAAVVATWTPHVVMLFLMAFAAAEILRIEARQRFYDYTNDPLFTLAAREQSGFMVASGAFHLPQLWARRPVLLDAGALDTLSYAPESGQAMDRILKDVYDLDLLHPPADIPPGLGVVPDPFNKRTWEGFSRARWQEIRREYDVNQVLVPVTYDLDLPIAAQARDIRLYVIPE